jgi:hypothetical protein
MFKTKINIVLLSFLIPVLIMITSNIGLAQNSSDSPDSSLNAATGIEALSQDLESKLSLTQTQSDSVRAILEDYQTGVDTSMNSTEGAGTMNNESVKNANSRIESLLNDSQKTLWANVRSDWWAKVKSSLNSN